MPTARSDPLSRVAPHRVARGAFANRLWPAAAVFTLLAVSSLAAHAALPPKYLAVPHFQQCLSSQSAGSYNTVCLPAARPAQCPRASWQDLGRLEGRQKVPRCRASPGR